MDLAQAILYAQLVNAAYAIPTTDVTNHAGQPIPVGAGYQVAFADRIRREAGIATGAVGIQGPIGDTGAVGSTARAAV